MQSTQNNILNGRMVIQNMTNTNFGYIRESLNAMVNNFKNLYENKGMFKVIDECEKSQLSGDFDDITINTASSAGRRLITLIRDDVRITFICADEEIESGMGWQDFYGTLSDINNLVSDFIGKWNNLDESQIKEIFKYDGPLYIV